MFTKSNKFLIEAIWTPNQDIIWIQRIVLITMGIVFLIFAATIKKTIPIVINTILCIQIIS